MSDGFTEVTSNVLLDYALSFVDQVRLLTANGDATTAGTEVTGGAYAPAAGVTWTTAAGMSSNGTAAFYADLPACTVVGFELWSSTGWDGATSQRIAFGPLDSPVTFLDGDDAEFTAGQLTLSLIPTDN